MKKIYKYRIGCELLSNFITLTDWKQRFKDGFDLTIGCELLSNFITLTDWKQRKKTSCRGSQVVNCFQTL